jgi:hypothetical protein
MCILRKYNRKTKFLNRCADAIVDNSLMPVVLWLLIGNSCYSVQQRSVRVIDPWVSIRGSKRLIAWAIRYQEVPSPGDDAGESCCEQDLAAQPDHGLHRQGRERSDQECGQDSFICQ